jgi:hypothetical protein
MNGAYEMLKCKNALIAAVVAGGLLGSVLLPTGQASAEVARLLQPNSSWAVSKIDASQGGAYCALARRFNSDMVLTFARNAQDESSVALDFQKKTLDQNNSYRLTMTPGYGQVRSFDIRPVSGKALVARLGQDYAFYDALARSGRLDVTVSGESYNFNLPDLNEGQTELNACLASLVQPAAGGSVEIQQNRQTLTGERDTSPSAQPSIPSQLSSQPLNNNELESLRMENLRLRNALERERRLYEEGYMAQGVDSSAVSELAEKVRLLEIENTQLRGQAQKVLGSSEQTSSCSVSVTEMEKLQNRVYELENENNTLKLSSSKDVKDPDIAALRSENLKLMQDLQAQKKTISMLERATSASIPSESAKGTIERLQEKVASLESENSLLMSKVNTKADSASSLESGAATLRRLKDVEAELKLVSEEKERLKRQLSEIRESGENAVIRSISSENWDLEQATRRYNEAERELRRLGTQLEEARANCEREKREIEYMLFDPEIAEKEQISRLIRLEENLNTAKVELKTQKDTYEDRIAHLEGKIKEMNTQRSAMADTAKQVNLATKPVETESLQPEASAYAGISPASGHPQPSVAAQYEPVPVRGLEQSSTSSGYDAYPAAHSRNMPQIPDLSPSMTNFMKAGEVESLLNKSGVSLQGKVQKVKSVEGDGFMAHSWDTGVMFGSIEQRPMAMINQFDILVGQYLRKTEDRCTGEFAAVPSVAQQYGTVRVEAYEIACIGNEDSASASILFFNRGDVFTTIAHEAAMDGMDVAMDTRDRLISTIVHGHVASQ